jgi:hypothetical protein
MYEISIVSVMVLLLMYGIGNYYFLVKTNNILKDTIKTGEDILKSNDDLITHLALLEETISANKQTISSQQEIISLKEDTFRLLDALLEERGRIVNALHFQIGLKDEIIEEIGKQLQEVKNQFGVI